MFSVNTQSQEDSLLEVGTDSLTHSGGVAVRCIDDPVGGR